ncbi:MAG: superoxide dismutase [OCS116 cluster bacterium]|uniref:Superoxide dismutase n=1 Tax=OCS116 cluster bacterium TaxID=2030921 RepID=A0A2A4Z8H7_9PROT|nr:superoxide dismutase [OCS116 cluster bacterium]
MAFELPVLPYAYDALDPYMSAETLEFHHDKHHNAYVTNGNNLLAGSGLEDKSLEDIIKATYGDAAKAGLFNNAAQHYNHMHFWNWMKKDGGGSIPGELEAKIIEDLGSVAALRDAFLTSGATQFGSGWCWLVQNADGKLEVTKTANGENPLCFNQTPLLGCDVWEHSYYIDYRNARPKYLEAYFDNMINWEYVAELFGNAS